MLLTNYALINQDLILNKPQGLICHKIQPKKETGFCYCFFNPFTIQGELKLSTHTFSQDFKCNLRLTCGPQICHRKYCEPHVALNTLEALELFFFLLYVKIVEEIIQQRHLFNPFGAETS